LCDRSRLIAEEIVRFVDVVGKSTQRETFALLAKKADKECN